ncbi:molybdate ABC transporter substrate-binding protein [Sphingobium subterraneum]|uniref:Molybdate transport system substrate-binding protein n=1 Tax=Sphingobium subterraneum TaxID=627688 RepID=A0A841J753_9SPHN|nr:molybdate ABC transporter substrate-binding protein [Sphingobium subterraneum]MBB6124378.1 molybdate transport system substrate-binding protein [Sphingobium subterraneum]
MITGPLKALLGAILAVIVSTTPALAQPGPLVLAASSLQESLTEAAGRWAAKGHPKPVVSFAASSALARQIGAGAPADLFISADETWMNDIAAKGLIRPGTRSSFLSNRLVLVAPAASRLRLTPASRFPLARALGAGRLAMADPDAVPAGKYAKAALVTYGVWPSVAGKLARAENVRAALALVERGEAPLGIVYATDARASTAVRVVGVFPPSSHPAITYPIATLKAATHPDTERFRRFLLSGEGKAIFRRYGFAPR